MPIKIIIHGKPIAKNRPRFARRGKFTVTYSDQETEEGLFILDVRQQLKGQEIILGPITLVAIFHFERPKSHFGTGRNIGKLKDSAPAIHIKKPDTDNLLKFVKDCLNGIAWKDDSQVFDVRGIKRYSDEPKTEIFITMI